MSAAVKISDGAELHLDVSGPVDIQALYAASHTNRGGPRSHRLLQGGGRGEPDILARRHQLVTVFGEVQSHDMDENTSGVGSLDRIEGSVGVRAAGQEQK